MRRHPCLVASFRVPHENAIPERVMNPMKRPSTIQYAMLAAIVACLLGFASWWGEVSWAVQDKNKVAKITANMKTMCIGRFLIDLPAEAEVTIDRGFVSGFDLSTVADENEDDFQSRLKKVEAGIIDARTQDKRPSLESATTLNFGQSHGKVWVYNRQRTSIPKGDHKIEIEDVSVRGMVRFPGLSLTASADGLPASSGKRLAEFLKQVRPLELGEIPTEPGFCIEHAIVRDPYEHRNSESVALVAGLPGHPDIRIAFSSMAGTAAVAGLLERNAAAAEREPFFLRLAFTTLREGKRITHGVYGEEVALRVRESNSTSGYSFQWEAPGKRSDIHAPLLTLELDAGTSAVNGGKPVQSSLSEDALTDLWERIASSIRPRPTNKAVLRMPVTAVRGAGLLSRTSLLLTAGEIATSLGNTSCSPAGTDVPPPYRTCSRFNRPFNELLL